MEELKSIEQFLQSPFNEENETQTNTLKNKAVSLNDSIFAEEEESYNPFASAVQKFNSKSEIEPDYIKVVKRLLVTPKVTDIHVTEGRPLCYRVKGEIHRVNVIVPETGITEITDQVFQLPIYDRANSSSEYAHNRVRLRFSKSKRQKQLFIRILPPRAPELESYGYDKVLPAELFMFPRPEGIIIVAGATGSGKSTMLASVLQRYLDTQQIHMITAEDPIEYILYDNQGEISQRELPDDVDTFDQAVINALREDPDIILIGETRDGPTAVATLQAAETGHLVFTTLHAPDVPGVIGRMLGLLKATVDSELRLANVLRAVVYLSLIQDPKTKQYWRRADVLWLNAEQKEFIRNKNQYHLLAQHIKSYRL